MFFGESKPQGVLPILMGGKIVSTRNFQSGFTLVEIVVVMIIIVTLAAMSIIPIIFGAWGRGLISGTTVELRSIALALEVYVVENDGYPDDTVESLDDFKAKYLTGKELVWLWDKSDLIVDVEDYSVNVPERSTYVIKKEIPSGLRYPAKVVGGLDFEPFHLRLTSERGIELGNFP